MNRHTRDFQVFDAPLNHSDLETAIPGITAIGMRREVQFTSIAAATLIETDQGARPAWELKSGDLIQTLDNGLQPLIWTSVGARPDVQAHDDATPIRIASGALGTDQPFRPVVVAPDQKVLVECRRCEDRLGHRQSLVAARDLLHLDGVERSLVHDQSMVHLMCATHEVLNIGGIWADSFCPVGAQINGLSNEDRDDLFEACPRLRFASGEASYVMSYGTLNSAEAIALL